MFLCYLFNGCEIDCVQLMYVYENIRVCLNDVKKVGLLGWTCVLM